MIMTVLPNVACVASACVACVACGGAPVVVPVALCVMLLQMDMDPVVTGVGRTAAFTWLYIFTAMGASLGIVGCVCATNTAAVL